MSSILVLGLVASVLSGYVGDTVNATVVLYSAEAQQVTIDGRSTDLPAQTPTYVDVPLRIEPGIHTHTITVQTTTVQHELPVTVSGRYKLWWMLAPALIPIACFCIAIRRRVVDSCERE
jgi:hypothetical protein